MALHSLQQHPKTRSSPPKRRHFQQKKDLTYSLLWQGVSTRAGITNDTIFSAGRSLTTTDSNMPILIYKLHVQQHFPLGTW